MNYCLRTDREIIVSFINDISRQDAKAQSIIEIMKITMCSYVSDVTMW